MSCSLCHGIDVTALLLAVTIISNMCEYTVSRCTILHTTATETRLPPHTRHLRIPAISSPQALGYQAFTRSTYMTRYCTIIIRSTLYGSRSVIPTTRYIITNIIILDIQLRTGNTLR